MPLAVAYLWLQSLTDEGRQVEEDLQEAEAKNRLYTLLLERTRREHMAIDQQVGLIPTNGQLGSRVLFTQIAEFVPSPWLGFMHGCLQLCRKDAAGLKAPAYVHTHASVHTLHFWWARNHHAAPLQLCVACTVLSILYPTCR